jgi:hypothetical protein
MDAAMRKPLRLTRPEPTEAAVLDAVRCSLRLHPAVAWVERINTGAAMVGEGARRRFVRFGFKGCADLIGQLRDGRFLAVETKRPSNRNGATEEQMAFLCRVRNGGGIAFVAWSVDEAWKQIDAAFTQTASPTNPQPEKDRP